MGAAVTDIPSEIYRAGKEALGSIAEYVGLQIAVGTGAVIVAAFVFRNMPVGVRAGIAALPDYLNPESEGLVRILTDLRAPKVDVFFVYPEELRNSKRVAVFRDFLLARLAEMH